MRRVLEAVGGTLIALGVVILLFVVYEVWGTGLIADREQRDLRQEFGAALESAVSDAEADPVPVVPGDAVALLEIPEIGVDLAVTEGVDVGRLRKGPGHYPDTVLPGRLGSAAIGGHRTTYGAPFNRLDELTPGDRIEVTTLEGQFVYRVREVGVAEPSDVDVLDPTPDAVLTLTTCHPKYSARQRLVVVADLDTRVSDEPRPSPGRPPGRAADLDAGETSGWASADRGILLWTAALALVGLGWWLVHRGRRHWLVSVAGALPVLIVLVFFFTELETLLPATF